ncbi:hypothetical protein GN244_ATG16558 [Phytophthora infestans]|nr:hypothetical protein GN244_ATG16558 [Phytophthora infestans]KAF4128056.1 hypothetical protein GN958_ATG22753 [Phytophthora infestans]
MAFRCFIANLALRRARLTVLGPAANNERKFTPRNETNRATPHRNLLYPYPNVLPATAGYYYINTTARAASAPTSCH